MSRNEYNLSIAEYRDETRNDMHNYCSARKIFAVILSIAICIIFIFAYHDELNAMNPDEYGYISIESQLYSDLIFTASSYINGQCVYYDDISLPPEKDNVHVMYNLLNDADKKVYDMFQDLVEHRDGENYTNGIIITTHQLDQLGSDYFWNIYDAFVYDHPEYFFLTLNPEMIHCRSFGIANYKVFIYMMDAENLVESDQIAAFNSATDEFFSDINLSLPKEDVELAIHDKLISLVNYDYGLLDEMKTDCLVHDIGHTAYGALVNKSAVCSGYCFAFEYLCQVAGIPCCILTGDAEYISDESSRQGTNGHSWNAVNLDGIWYEVDATWNDYEYDESMDYSIYEALRNESETFDNVIHHFYNKTTDEMEYLMATDDTLFDLAGYLPFNAKKDSSHIRYTTMNGDADDRDAFRNRLIPLAF